MRLDEFKEYIRAFNAADYDTLTSFYLPTITLTLPSNHLLQGRDAVADFYRQFRATSGEEQLDILDFAFWPKEDGNEGNGSIFYGAFVSALGVCCSLPSTEMHAWFHHTLAAGAGSAAIPGQKPPEMGDLVRMTTWARYEVVGGKFESIRVSLFKYENLGRHEAIPWVEGRMVKDR